MMEKEWIDIVDTAVKIGLGALITGAFSYFGLKLSDRSNKEKMILEHRTKLIEQVAVDVEVYFAAWDRYISKIGGIAKHRLNRGKETEELGVNQKKAIKDRDLQLIEAIRKRSSAVATLRLMKANDAAISLSETKELIQKFRHPIVFDKKFPLRRDVQLYQEEVKVRKIDFHEKLADFYEQIQN